MFNAPFPSARYVNTIFPKINDYSRSKRTHAPSMSVTRRDRKNPCYFGPSGKDFSLSSLLASNYHSSRVQIIFNLGGKPIDI